jgi:hypothetical protein
MSKISELNDALRRTFTGGRIVMSAAFAALPEDTRRAVIAKVRGFGEFTKDNGPYGENDFGAFDHDGERFNFKIDYYAPDMENGSNDPADPRQTVRVLTIMLASDY